MPCAKAHGSAKRYFLSVPFHIKNGSNPRYQMTLVWQVLSGVPQNKVRSGFEHISDILRTMNW